jgi:nucleoside-diphosphate-sugar epimerase
VVKRCLITGCSGFIGRHLVAALLHQDMRLRGLTRSHVDVTPQTGLELYHGDLTRAETLNGIGRGIDTIFHTAGHAHAVGDAAALHKRTTVEGTRNLLAEAERRGVRRFVFISSVKAMADPGDGCIDETMDDLPIDAYGLSRRKAEDLVLETGTRTGMHVSILRPALVYGPGCKGNLFKMLELINSGMFPPVPDSGNRRSMVDVRDLISAMLLAARQPAANGRTFIITDGEDYSTKRMYSAIRTAMGKPLPRWSVPAGLLRILGMAGDGYEWLLRRPAPFNSNICTRLLDSACYHSCCAEQVLGYRPVYRFEDAVPEILACYRESRGGTPQFTPPS